MFSSSLHTSPELPHVYTLYSKKRAHQDKIRELRKRIQDTRDVLQLEELKYRKRVLRRLNFTNSADIVDIKGRVACEISTGDELLLTEMIFNGVFNLLAPEQCAALLSCFVFTEKVRGFPNTCLNRLTDHIHVQSEKEMNLKEELAAPLRVMQEFARRIAKVSKESKLTIEEDEYVSSFKVELMDAVIQWCRGVSFTDILKVNLFFFAWKSSETLFQFTDQFEGTIIRVFRRLSELIRQMAQAAKVIGNHELKAKFEKASEMLERPNSVIFCSSLYL